MSLSTILAMTIAAGAPLPIASASRFRPLPPEDGTPARSAPVRTAAPKAAQSLPYARGRTFATLEAYLAFRREQGAIDLPWYEEVEPGIFLLRTTRRPQPAPQRVTRAELARKFGFDR